MKRTFRGWPALCMLAALLLIVACAEPTEQGSVDPAQAAQPTELPQQVISIVTEPPIDNTKLEEMNTILRRATFLDGVTVCDVPIGGMTIEEATTAVSGAVAEAKSKFTVSVQDGESIVPFSGAELTVNDNLEDVLTEAFNLVREDKGYDEVMTEVAEIKEHGKAYEVDLSFDDAALKNAILAYASEHNTEPVNASVAYDSEQNAIAYTDDVPGKTVDQEAMATALKSASDGDTIEAPMIETLAEITRDNVKEKFVLRGRKTTSYADSDKNRKYNVKKGAEMISGTLMHPGDVFSANGTLGTRTIANGWKKAGAYEAGAVVKQAGGGVCQLSTTLYNAAVMADMEIVERRNHSMKVSYIDQGLDATINSTGNIIDFKFKNSSKSDILIIAYADGSNLTFEIYGIPVSEDCDGEYDEIKIPKPTKTKTIKPSGDTEYVLDESKPAGYKEKVHGKKDGSVWQSYKEYYKDGQLIKKEKLDVSTYKAYNSSYIVGPDKEAEESPKATASSDPTAQATEKPTDTPKATEKPTEAVTEKPTDKPTEAPTEKPTEAPTEKPTDKPTEAPTKAPDPDPTKAPDPDPTKAPESTKAPEPDPTDSGSEG